MAKSIIVNSDDFGISEGVSRGIIEAHQKGIVTSTSVMVNMPAAAEAIQQAHHSVPNLGLGLHLVLSFGRPVSDPDTVPSLIYADDGSFCSTWDELMFSLQKFAPEDLEREFNAQFDRFVELAGHIPYHIDSHHHGAYLTPSGFESMLKLALKHNIPIRRPRWVDNHDILDGVPHNKDLRLRQMLREMRDKYPLVVWPDFNIDATFFWDRRDRVASLTQALKAVEDGYSEVMCHVGYGEGLEEDYVFQREDELGAYTDPTVVQLVKDEEIQLITFADLPR